MRKIKLSDFGSALESGENKITDNLVARYYRPPEIYLGYPYDYSLDIWSFGCTLFELFTGKVLFPGCSDSHVLKLMMEVKGGIPKKMRNQGQFVDRFFDQFHFVFNDGESVKKIPIGEVKKEKSLISMLGVQSSEEKEEVMKLGNLLEQCLELDPNERISPETALLHPFLMK